MLTLSPRYEAVDLLRGVVMVLMVLDHTRYFFGDATLDPTDLSKVTPALFLTRWVTHFCAGVRLPRGGGRLPGWRPGPVSGRARGIPRHARALADLPRVDRGEIRLPLQPSAEDGAPCRLLVDRRVVCDGVRASLPAKSSGRVLGVLLIATHNLIDFDSFSSGAHGPLQPLAVLLLRPGMLTLPGGVSVLVGYPLLPWFGVVAAGYGFAEVIRLEPWRRRSIMLVTGLGLIVAFVALRAWGIYGEPRAWTFQPTPILTALSFVNCTEYPPSLLFLLMTLGPAIVVLAVFDHVGVHGPVGRALVTLGRVPLFFYVSQWYAIHGYAIHALAVLVALGRGFPVDWLFSATFPIAPPPGWPLNLPGIYAVWAAVLAFMLAYVCALPMVRRGEAATSWRMALLPVTSTAGASGSGIGVRPI